MDTIATNGIVNTEANLVDERNLDKPTDVEQNGESRQNTASEQVLGTNTSISKPKVNIDDNAQSLLEKIKKIRTVEVLQRGQKDKQSLCLNPSKIGCKPSKAKRQNCGTKSKVI